VARNKATAVDEAGRRTPAGGRGGDPPDLAPGSVRAEEILSIVTRLFFEHGYRGVGIRMIADTVGARPSSLYHHFPNKEAMLYRIALRATIDFIDVHAAMVHGDGDIPTRLRELVKAHVVYFGENKLAQQVAERELRELDEDHYDEVRRRQREYLDALSALIEKGCETGDLHVEHPRIATRALLDMLNNFNKWFEPRKGLDLAALGDLYSAMIVEGLLGAAPAGAE
jgi:AcrR family transcriptional regulator